MPDEATVYIVDDDEAARISVAALVKEMGIAHESFASAEEFLEKLLVHRPGCLVTDVRMLGMSGVELQEELTRRGSSLPVIVITAHAETPLTVRAIKNGAVTLLEKPCREYELWDAIRHALELDAHNREQLARHREIQRRLNELTVEEREVMDLMIEGHANKVIAKQLDVSIRTVEARRQRVFAKMKTSSLAELVRMVIEAQGTQRST